LGKKAMGKGILPAGLALFSMMFGAGNIVFPILLGEYSGSLSSYALAGFLLGGIAIPFLGLIAMMLYEGNYREFFGRLGERTGSYFYLFLIAILGPIGSIPRLITVAYGTMRPYLPEMPFALFSFGVCLITLLFALKRTKILNLLAYALTPLLLLSLGIIIGRGLMDRPGTLTAVHPAGLCFSEGLQMGYNLLDLVAAFLYATLVLNNLRGGSNLSTKQVVRKAVFASLIATVLLGVVYAGLTYVGAYHGPAVRGDGASEEMVRAVSIATLGSVGGVVACVAVGLACLTTAISLTVVCSNFLQSDVLKGKGGYLTPVLITLGISFAISNLGFTGIAALIGPVLKFLHPALIVLCLLNIAHKLYNFRPVRLPIFATLAVSAFAYI
jgi:branched-chain amino acid:cation transporter, LIVCS family